MTRNPSPGRSSMLQLPVSHSVFVRHRSIITIAKLITAADPIIKSAINRSSQRAFATLNQHFTKALAGWFTSSFEVTSDSSEDQAGRMKIADRILL